MALPLLPRLTRRPGGKAGAADALGGVLALLVALTLGASPARAAEAPVTSGQPGRAGWLTIEAGMGKVVNLQAAAANVFVADPKVAEIRPASTTALFIFGVSAGRTTVAALDADGNTLAQYDLTVQPRSFGARQAQALIRRLVSGSQIEVRPEGKGLVLTGTVASPQDAAQAVTIAKGFASDGQSVDNQITITASTQVTLNVRIAEMSRTVVRTLGVNWTSIASIGTIGKLPALIGNINGSTVSCAPPQGNFRPICPGANFNAVIDALAQDNLAHILAEPNLTVRSGQSASFQVGGEYPIPVNQTNGAISIDFKSYGIMLTFVPTVMSDGRIDIHVRPEVSQLDKTNGVTLNEGNSVLVVPAITVRRAETTVELGSGESFAIAGLLQQTTQDNGQGLPGLGDIPVAGALFHHTELNKQEDELVIVVTPYVVRPTSRPEDLHLPTDGYRTPTDLQRLLFMRQVSADQPPVPVHIPGNAGFMVQ
jgi:pilus assembly protein CpaC